MFSLVLNVLNFCSSGIFLPVYRLLSYIDAFNNRFCEIYLKKVTFYDVWVLNDFLEYGFSWYNRHIQCTLR